MKPHGTPEEKIEAWAFSAHVVHCPLPPIALGWVLGHHSSALEGSMGAVVGRAGFRVCLLLNELKNRALGPAKWRVDSELAWDASFERRSPGSDPT